MACCNNRFSHRWLSLGLPLVVALLANAGWRHFGPVLADSGWRVDVYMDNVDRVSALSRDEAGNLYISQEVANAQGDILRRDSEGRMSHALDGLSKPDGMIRFGEGFVFSQEQGPQAVIWSDGSTTRPLFEADSIEGLAADEVYLYAVEDIKHDGRLLRFDPQNRELKVLRSGLDEAEGVAVCPNGDLYYVEKGRATVWKFNGAEGDRAVATGLREPGMVMCDEAGLWVTEDATHMARVLLLKADGELCVVLSHLRSAQTILPLGGSQYLVAEQGRNRILKLQAIDRG